MTGFSMKNKELQEQRMRGYFIEATKDILKGEGLKSVNVRNIAQQAGYSYATLYNYFNDVKDLIFECVKDFLEEASQFINQEIDSVPNGLNRIKAISKAYIKYFIQYPGIFELFFIERTYDLSRKRNTIDLIIPFFDELCNLDWDYYLQKKQINIDVYSTKRKTLNFTILGLLLLYLHRGYPSEYTEFLSEVDQQIDQILD